MSVKYLGAMASVLASLIIAGCGQSSDDNQADSGLPGQPNDEVAFVTAKTDIESNYDQAPNDIVKSQIMERWRAHDSCKILAKPQFTKWAGRITTILSNGGFIVSLGRGVEVEGDADQGSGLFQTLSTMHEGDAVTISGMFIGDEPDCPTEVIAVPWGDSAIRNPDFKVKLIDLEPM